MTITQNSQLTGPLSSIGFLLNGKIDHVGRTLAIGGSNASIIVFGTTGQLVGTGTFSLQINSGGTILIQKTNVLQGTGIININGGTQTRVIPAMDYSTYATVNINGSANNPNAFIVTAGIMKVVGAFNITQSSGDGNNITVDCATNNPSFEFSDGVNFHAGTSNYTTTWTKGTGTIDLKGTTTQAIDFNGQNVESFFSSGTSIKSIASDFTTTSFSGSAGSLKSTVDGTQRTITCINSGTCKNMTFQDIVFSVGNRIRAMFGCKDNGNNSGIVFSGNPLFSWLYMTFIKRY